MFTMLSIGTMELAFVGLAWLTVLLLRLIESAHARPMLYGACAVTLAVAATPADLVSSVVLTALLLLAFFIGLSHQRTVKSI